MIRERNSYGFPVVSKDVPMTIKEATACRMACLKVLLQTPPSQVWNDLHTAYMSVCITFGLPTKLPTRKGGEL